MKILLLSVDNENSLCISKIKNCFLSRGVECDCFENVGNRKCDEILRKGGYSSAIIFDARLAAFASEFKTSACLGTEIIFACSNYCCLKDTAKANCDKYILPHIELQYRFVTAGIPQSKLIATGMPLDDSFLTADKKKSRKEIGLDESKNNILFLCDELKIKKSKILIKNALNICKDSYEIVVLCDKKLKARRLTDRFAFHKNVCIESDDEYFSLLLSACDTLVTSPKAGVASLAALNNIPLVLIKTDSLPEKMNVRFFCDRGMAFSGKSLVDCVSYAVRLCESERLRDNMISAQKKYFHHGSIENLCEYVCKK